MAQSLSGRPFVQQTKSFITTSHLVRQTDVTTGHQIP